MKISEKTMGPVRIVESDRSKLPEAVLCRVVYPICNIGQLNANNRVYEKEVWEKVLSDESIVEKMKSRTLFGQAEHPAETQSDLQLTSHTIFETWIEEDGRVYQKIDVLDTPTGRIVDTLLRAGCQVGVSTRAEGDLEEYELGEGQKCQRVIPETYRYVTTDFTADPSTFNVEPVALQRNVLPTLRKEMENKEGGRLAKLLYESIQKTDEAHTSVTVTSDGGDTVTVEAEGNVTATATSNGSVTVTPDQPVLGMEDPGNTGLGMPAVEPEEDMVGDEVEGEPEPAEEFEDEGAGDWREENESKITKQEQARFGSKGQGAKGKHKKKKQKKSKMKESVVGISSYKEAGLLTGDLGFVMELDNGQKFNVTIQQDDRHGREGNIDVAQIYEVLTGLIEEYADEFGAGEEEENESKLTEDKFEPQSYKNLVDLKVKEASIRAERDTLLESAQCGEDRKIQIQILVDKIKEIQEAAKAEIAGLRRVLEKKAKEVGLTKQQLAEALATRKSEAELNAMFKVHQDELVKAVNEAKAEAHSEMLREYFDRHLASTGLQVDGNSRALLENCQSLGDVDTLLERLVGVARRSALHSKPLSEVKVRKMEPIDPEQAKADAAVGSLMKHIG